MSAPGSQQAAPFLQVDDNPYPVVAGGHVYWIVDAYTTTDDYPYAEQAETSSLSVGERLDGSSTTSATRSR